jgi:ubiquinone/menaquinone biosynthesis C-methylase UbiE
VAPEPSLAPKFRHAFDYLSVDLDGNNAMMAMNITALTFPSEFFEAVVCNHVLEHVPDDRKALSELYRVLKKGGWGSIQVPMRGESTFEDPSVTDPLERDRLFGQDDHVRQYGRDYLCRLQEAGFNVLVLEKAEIASPEELERLSVAIENSVVLVLKPS